MKNLIERSLLTLGAVVAALLVIGAFEASAKRPAHAGPPAQYAFTLDQAEPVAAGTEVTFTVTRSAADNDPVHWVALRCDDGSGGDAVVAWGLFSSLEGHAGGSHMIASGTECTAHLTRTPWNPKPNDSSITFAVQ